LFIGYLYQIKVHFASGMDVLNGFVDLGTVRQCVSMSVCQYVRMTGCSLCIETQKTQGNNENSCNVILTILIGDRILFVFCFLAVIFYVFLVDIKGILYYDVNLWNI